MFERRELGEHPIYLDDAGAVLLHPFFLAHFEKLGWQKDGRFVDDLTRERAVHQIRFLATGHHCEHESLLVLAKILCGMTPSQPVAEATEPDDASKAEAEVLLRAVIRNWGALKNTSPDGLRDAFLQRDGRLMLGDAGWKLQVEARGVDVLINRLPWSLSVVRLPWMSELLFVEWG